MTSDGGYPGGDVWPEVLDQYRCREIAEGRRCQLYASHEGECAHAAGTPATRSTLWRWRPGGAPWVDVEWPRLRWCCMFGR